MKIKIRLEQSLGRLINKSPFLLADEPMTLEFESDVVLADCFVEMRNGDDKIKLYEHNLREIAIPRALKKAGELFVVIGVVVKGTVVKRWSVEPIILKEIDLGFEAYAGIAAIVNNYEAIKQQLAEQQTTIAELRQEVSDLNEILER